MSLPKLEVPTFELSLPSSGKKIKYRPFLVKEHKTLLLLKESSDDDISRILEEIVDTCTFNKLNVKALPSFDLEYIFLNLRARSIGETVDLLVNCDCGNKIDYQMNIDALEVKRSESHKTKIMLTDTIGIEMKYPRFQDTMGIFVSKDQKRIFDLVLSCINAIYTTDGDYHLITDENIGELDEFVSDMTKEQFDMIEEFFYTMPKLVQTIDVTCDKCGAHNHATLEGLQNFFV
jgi:hypothetical protein